MGDKTVGYFQSVALDMKTTEAAVKEILVVRVGLEPGTDPDFKSGHSVPLRILNIINNDV